MQSKFKAIIFDLGGVLLNLDYNKTIIEFQKLGKKNFDDLYTQAKQTRVFDQFETGKINANEFRTHLKGLFDKSVSYEAIDFAWNAMLLDFPKERIALLKNLRKKHQLFLFSNTNAIHYTAFRKIIKEAYGNANLLESLFDKTYYSHLIHQRKPNSSAFEYILKEQNLRPDEILFIDDSIQHIQGAQSLGIETIHLFDKEITTVFNSFSSE